MSTRTASGAQSVVIVHAGEDSMPAKALAQKLAALGYKPVIDLTPGEFMTAALHQAKAVIALWSPRSSERADLVDALGDAAVVVHARMQSAPLPAAFMGAQAFDLTGWRGEDDFGPWRALIAALAEAVRGPAAPPPPASAPRFAPVDAAPSEAAPESPRAPDRAAPEREPPARETFSGQRPPYFEPERRAPNLVVVGAITFLAVAALGGGGYFVWDQMQTRSNATAQWDSIDINSAQALRAFIAGNPGPLRAEAEQALSVLEENEFDAAREADTIESFEAFLENFPDSAHSLEARGRIAELRVAPQPAAVDPSLDPLTGEPFEPLDPDLVPPGALETAPAGEAGGGPVALTPPEPPPTAEPPAPSDQPPAF